MHAWMHACVHLTRVRCAAIASFNSRNVPTATVQVIFGCSKQFLERNGRLKTVGTPCVCMKKQNYIWQIKIVVRDDCLEHPEEKSSLTLIQIFRALLCLLFMCISARRELKERNTANSFSRKISKIKHLEHMDTGDISSS